MIANKAIIFFASYEMIKMRFFLLRNKIKSADLFTNPNKSGYSLLDFCSVGKLSPVIRLIRIQSF